MKWLILVLLLASCNPSFYQLEYEYQEVKIVRDYMCDPYDYLLTFPGDLPNGLVDFTRVKGIAKITQIDSRNLIISITEANQSTIHKFIRQLK